MLSRVERPFPYLRTSSGIRPNYHQKERRLDGHIFISILPYHLPHAVEQILLAGGEHRSWPTVKEVLKTQQVITVRLPDAECRAHHLRLASNPSAAQKRIYAMLSLSDRPFFRRRYVLGAGEM